MDIYCFIELEKRSPCVCVFSLCHFLFLAQILTQLCSRSLNGNGHQPIYWTRHILVSDFFDWYRNRHVIWAGPVKILSLEFFNVLPERLGLVPHCETCSWELLLAMFPDGTEGHQRVHKRHRQDMMRKRERLLIVSKSLVWVVLRLSYIPIPLEF